MTIVMDVLDLREREELCLTIKEAGARTLDELVVLIRPYFDIDALSRAQKRVDKLQADFKAAMNSEGVNPLPLFVRNQLTEAQGQAAMLSAQRQDPVADASDCIAMFVASGQLVPADEKECAECFFYRAVDDFSVASSLIASL